MGAAGGTGTLTPNGHMKRKSPFVDDGDDEDGDGGGGDNGSFGATLTIVNKAKTYSNNNSQV